MEVESGKQQASTPSTLEREQSGAVGVEGAENDLALVPLLQHNLHYNKV